MCQSFIYAGLDLILDKNGRWFLIEANDHPIGLAEADRLALSIGRHSLFEAKGFHSLAQALVNKNRGGVICLLMPDCFRFASLSPFGKQVKLVEEVAFDDARIMHTVNEFNSLARAIHSLNAECRIVDLRAFVPRGRDLYLTNGDPVGVLYRRAYRFPPHQVSCPCFNDLRLRTVCPDKLKTDRILRQRLLDWPAFLPSTFPFEADQATRAALQDLIATDRYVIVKPNFGSASTGVSRFSVREVLDNLEDLCQEQRNSYGDVLCQKWIEPSVVRSKQKDYYFDVRVFVLDGQPVSGFARRASAPAHQPLWADSPLSWLTTTGPPIPLAVSNSPKPDIDNVAFLTVEQAESLKDLCVEATLALDKFAVELDYAQTFEDVQDFESLAGSVGQMQYLDLVAI